MYTAWCDAELEGGGWTTVLRRQDGSIDFGAVAWNDYASSNVGSPDGEFMMNLALLNLLTKDQRTELYVSMLDGAAEGVSQYGLIFVDDVSNQFQLSISEYGAAGSNAGDPLIAQHNGRYWSAYDNDNDLSGGNCASQFLGAFWYSACHATNPLGDYGNNNYAMGVTWSTFRPQSVSLSFLEFKIRSNPCPSGPSQICSSCGASLYLCTTAKGARSCCASPITSCEEATHNGVYEISQNLSIMAVYCSFNSQGGGWTTTMRRGDGSVDF